MKKLTFVLLIAAGLAFSSNAFASCGCDQKPVQDDCCWSLPTFCDVWTTTVDVVQAPFNAAAGLFCCDE